MKKFLIFIFLTTLVFANSCYKKVFNYSNSENISDRMTIKEFLELLVTQKCNINIVYKDDKAKAIVNEKMPFVRFKKYTLNDILNFLLSQKGVFYDLDANTLEVSYYKTRNYRLDFISSNRIGESNLNTTDSKIKNEYNFDFWDKIENNIKTILSNVSNDVKPPIIDRSVGLITVTGNKKQLEEVDKYIKTLIKRLSKEVLIDVKIYAVELSKSHSTGINWATLNAQLNVNNAPLTAKNLFGSGSVFDKGVFNARAFLNFLAQNGNVNSLSNPKIVTLNNQKAIISVGDTIYYKYASSVVMDQNGNPVQQYTVSSNFVGIVLDITPQISDDNEITLSITPQISAFKDPNQLNNPNRNMPPDTKINTMLSIVKLKDNQTLVLGGLITNEKSLTSNGVPILKEIPVIKYLFSSKDSITSKRELVFVITPHVINLKTKKSLRDLGFDRF